MKLFRSLPLRLVAVLLMLLFLSAASFCYVYHHKLDFIAVGFISLLKLGHFCGTCSAPACPEVYYNGFAIEV